MKKIENRHHLILTIIAEKRIHTQEELQEALADRGIEVTQSTLSRDIKHLNLIKLNHGENSYYVTNYLTPSRWEHRLRTYMEDALVMMRPVQHQVIIKTLPGLAQSFGSILDALALPEMIATICGDDVCVVICEDVEAAHKCFETLKQYTPPFFFSR